MTYRSNMSFDPEADVSGPPSRMLAATKTILFGLLVTSIALPADYTSNIFTVSAVGVGATLSLATGIEAMAGVRSLIRVDLLMLWALYGLTLLEFLFPQPGIDDLVTPAAAVSGTYAVLLGFASLAVGRHLVKRRRRRSQISGFIVVPPTAIFLLFLLATLVGYLHIFLAVNFDPFEVLRQMSLPRFSQSWSRGRYGDASALLVELGALIYLIPPIAGLVYARSKNYNLGQKVIVTIVLLFTLYYGFASGTRNIIATYVITFLVAYFLNKSELKLWQVVCQGLPILALLFLGMVYMLAFRGAGLERFSFEEYTPKSLYIDRNMVVIARITELFPNEFDFLGLEVPFYGLVHPIPRILWPDKPEGLSVSIEAALGADPAAVTFASTFVGEAYMSGGLLAVVFAGLLFGAAAEMWNRVAHGVNSSFAKLVYASGFFCAFLTMRSLVWMTVAMLPTLALWLYGKLWLPRSSPRRAASVTRPSKGGFKT
jgi:oligosaccharide repeat unit polymerase